jgi:hypothetical protein
MMRKPSVNQVTLAPKDVVFVFDEFDLTIKELSQRNAMNKTILNSWSKDVQDFQSRFKVEDQDLNNGKKKNIGAMKLSSTGFGGEDDIQLADLLSIFQGIVPSDQALMFATSNEYNEMKSLCPPLFRDGRLTPILFDNFDSDLLNAFSEFHFRKPVLDKSIDLKLKICPSTVVEALSNAVATQHSGEAKVRAEKTELVCPKPMATVKDQQLSAAAVETANSDQVNKIFEEFQKRILASIQAIPPPLFIKSSPTTPSSVLPP